MQTLSLKDPRLASPLAHVRLWPSYLISLSLIFLIHKREITHMTLTLLQGYYSIKLDSIRAGFNT